MYLLLITPLVSFTVITSGHCVVDLLTASYRFAIFKHLLLVAIVLSIYSLLITALVSSNTSNKCLNDNKGVINSG
jgi:hypothetical protein